MNKWQCTNPECSHTWSEKQPIVCPQCGSTNFNKVNTINWAKIAKIIGALIILILLLNWCKGGCGDKKNVVATITFKEGQGTLEVDLKVDKKNQNDFTIELIRGSSVYQSVKGLKAKTFIALNPGTYYVNVKYIGTSSKYNPQITYNPKKGPYTIQTPPPPPPPPPSIVSVNPVLNKARTGYTLTVNIKPASLMKDCQFSIDGSNFKSSNVFSNVQPGDYTVTARLIKDKSVSDTYNITLDKIPPPNLPSKQRIQSLLDSISDGDNSAFDVLSALLATGNIKVTGAGSKIGTLYDLMVDCDSGSHYTINRITVVSHSITSIHVKRN